jgi:hypothetical protein
MQEIGSGLEEIGSGLEEIGSGLAIRHFKVSGSADWTGHPGFAKKHQLDVFVFHFRAGHRKAALGEPCTA